MSLEGDWYNELGSKMVLKVQGNVLAGIYNSAVGPAKGDYVLAGLVYPDQDGASRTLGFSVIWTNDQTDLGSVTAWSGQWQKAKGEDEQIVTMWLLTVGTAADDDWEAFRTGQDVFTRDKPKSASVKSARKTTSVASLRKKT